MRQPAPRSRITQRYLSPRYPARRKMTMRYAAGAADGTTGKLATKPSGRVEGRPHFTRAYRESRRKASARRDLSLPFPPVPESSSFLTPASDGSPSQPASCGILGPNSEVQRTASRGHRRKSRRSQVQRLQFERCLRLCDPEVATANSPWKLTVGPSSKKKPTSM